MKAESSSDVLLEDIAALNWQHIFF